MTLRLCTASFKSSRLLRSSASAGILALAWVHPVPSQTSGIAPLRLGALYSEVQQANPRSVAAAALVRASRARVTSTIARPDPQVQLGFMNYNLPRFTAMPAIGMVQLQVMQMVPLGGKLGLERQIAEYTAAATGNRAEEIAWELRGGTAMAFYDLYNADRALEVVRETLQLLRRIEETADGMYRVGEGRQADVLSAQVEVARMAEDTVRMQAMRETMIAKLNALLDRDPGAAVGAPVLPRFPDVVPSRASLDSAAMQNRPMLRAAADDIRAATTMSELARKALLPDLQVGFQIAQQGTEMGTERMGSLMIGTSIPLFSRQRQTGLREEADAMRAMADADLATMRATTRGKIGETYASLVRARNLRRLYRESVLPQAEATAGSALASYRVGGVDLMTLLGAQMTVNKYRQEVYLLDADEGKAWAELEMLTGRVWFDANVPAATATPPGDQ